MAIERTLSIVKPDAVRKRVVGSILARFERDGLRVAALRMVRLSRRDAEGFYAVHRARPFFDELCEFMSSGPCVALVLEGEDAVLRNREIMGATDPAKAAEGTLRKLYGTDIGKNAVHGSDAVETARTEIAWFFSAMDLAG
jgi:nucleoside-diphosphate kinase